MDAFIQFKVGADGELAIVIHKLLWEELHKGDVNAEADGDFVRVDLTALTRENLVELTGAPGIQQFPCRPAFQLAVEP